jgi:hypothetical protein
MSKNVKVTLLWVFAAAFLGLTADYFPDSRTGYALYSVLFVVTVYPLFRAFGDVSDRAFVVAALLFVPGSIAMRELKQYLPSPFIRYSAAALVSASVASLFTGARKHRHS